ncbi:transporter [Lutimonas sp.]|uniref:transporter n=1 Tax=Lutimonas sp. TaxID=1872403 RepID=UPI003C706981
MRLFFFAIVAFLFISLPIFSQTVEPAMAVDRNTLQLELESLYVMEKDGADRVNSWSIPSVLMRYGISNSIELQLNIPYLRESIYEDNNAVNSRTFLDNVQMGVSVNLWEEQGALPQAALMARALVPVYDYQTSEIGTLLALNFSNTISNQLSLNYNLGWINDTEGNSAYYIANLSWEISQTIHSFVEFFGSTYNKIDMNHNINSGVGFNLGESFCLDLSVASGLNQQMLFFGGVLTYQFSI